MMIFSLLRNLICWQHWGQSKLNVLAAWKLRCQTPETSSSSQPSTALHSSPASSQSSSTSSSQSPDVDWVDTFLIPWDTFFGERKTTKFTNEKRDGPNCGQSCFSSKRFLLCVDRNVVHDNIPSFISALCMMFGSYYCFDIHYPSELASILEFLQKCFFSINSEKGTKVEKTNTARLHVNPRVLTLIQELSDHEWRDV